MKQKTTAILQPATNSPSLFTASHRSMESGDKKKSTGSIQSFLNRDRSDERASSKTYSNHHTEYLDPNEDRPE